MCDKDEFTSYLCEGDENISITFKLRLRGDGAKSTIKGHLKKATVTTTSEGNIFTGLYQACAMASLNPEP